jgi:cell surface protein SprA
LAVSKFFPQLLIGSTIGAAFVAGFLRSEPELQILPSDSNEYYFNPVAPQDTPPTLPYPLDPNDGNDPFSDDENNFDLEPEAEPTIIYDPETDEYIFQPPYGTEFYEDPQYITFEEYVEAQSEKALNDYWQERSDASNILGGSGQGIELTPFNSGCRLFDGCNVEIRPQGNVELTFGGSFQNIENPILTENQRRQGGFDFNMDINANVIGSIGNNLKLNFNYNTQATFDFENQIELKYQGKEDQIVRGISAGNVSLPLTTQLIPGTQSLFGIKTEFQFGRLTMTNILSQQKSQTQSIQIEGGAQKREFEIFADQYDENRHFFMSHYFRQGYEGWLKTLPYVSSPIMVTRMEVWVTNTTGETQNTRDIVAFSDLGEPDSIYWGEINPSGTISSLTPGGLPSNYANDLYQKLSGSAGTRDLNTVISTLSSPTFGMQAVQDYEKARMRKLDPTDYIFNPQLGFISLNTTLQPDDVLAIAYEYTYQGQNYQVGEFSSDLPPGVDTSNVLFMKMLKSTSAITQIPLWDLMMKNVYSLGAFQVSSDGFRLDVLYQDPGGGLKRYIPANNATVNSQPLIKLLGLDRLNNNNDPQSDGIFDFVNGTTINTQNGRIYFPVLEPFGSFLRSDAAFAGDLEAEKFAYDELYDQTKTVALQFPQFDRYVISGEYKSSVSSEIYLGAFNLPQGSVQVTAGGQLLTENVDYTIDYSLGRLKIINESILNSGQQINVNFENNAFYGFQTRSLIGTRLDYWINDNFTLGATWLRLSERPYTQKVNVGDDPIANSIYGFDVNYTDDAPWMTRALDKLPFYSTKEMSTFSFTGEVAAFRPGHSKAIGKDEEGTIYIDDFEGSRSAYDLKFPFASWVLASTPQNATDENGDILFPEATLFDSLEYGKNRAKIAWYNIDPLFNEDNNPSKPDHLSAADLSNHYTIQIDEKEIFPQADFETTILTQLSTFDLAYYPNERGPYNYDVTPSPFSAGINSVNGELNNPESRWGGIMRNLETNDFEAANIEFVEFWVMDPFDNRGPIDGEQVVDGGYLTINLGNVSEDILKDSRMFFENGLPKDGSVDGLDQTNWGNVPRTLPITTAFDNDIESRINQDKGYDGFNSIEEADYFSDFITDATGLLGGGSEAIDLINEDPASDDYHYYRGTDYDNLELSILERYKRYNNPQGNSPTTESSPEDYPTAATTIPETEDLNDDFTLTETESYFQYRIKMEPGMEATNPYITDVVIAPHSFEDGSTDSVKWYQFKVPINQYDTRVGSIQDFRSIRFIRMYMTDFEQPVVLRFARLELVRNQWRRFQFSLLNPGEYLPDDDGNETDFNVSSVSIEENSVRVPIPYALPPGVEREQTLGSGSSVSTFQQNEQSLSMQICPLQDGDARAVFKSLNIDLRRYGRMIMNVHAEPLPDAPLATLNDGDLHLFIRLGSDFTNNYYEYDIPLKVTKLPLPAGTTEDDAVREAIWATLIDFPLDSLVAVKTLRNQNEISPLTPYSVDAADGITYTIIGNPDLGYVEEIMIGVRNPKEVGGSGEEFCAEVWVNELRLTGIDERGGWAALARADFKLADLGTFTVSGNMHTAGFGTLEQQIDERYRDNFYQYAASLSLELGKFLPQGVNLRLPLYASISESYSNPEFDPYDLDIDLADKVANIETTYGADSAKNYKSSVIDFIAIKSINLSNVRFERGDKAGNPMPWDKENFDLTLAYSQEYNSNPILEYDVVNRYKAALGYSFNQKAKYITPLEKVIDKKYKWLTPIRDFNFNLLPTGYSFRTELNRQFGETLMRDIYGDGLIDPTFDKYFTWDRYYGLKLEPAKSIKIDFSATNNARVDEPFGKLDTQEKRDSVWMNFMDLGRTTNYRHTLSATYTLPISKLPLFSWVTVKANYNTSYGWIAGSLGLADTLGNTINNTQSRSVNGELNFRNLYNKSKFFKQYNSNTSPPKGASKGAKDEEAEDDEAKPATDPKKGSTPTVSAPVEGLVRLLIGLKRVTVNYTQNYGTTIPGFMQKSEILGLNTATTAPGFDFIFGYQPSYRWMDSIADLGYMSTATTLNYLFLQTYSEVLDVRANFEPLKDFRLDINLNKNYTKNHSEYFKNVMSLDDPEFEHLNAVDAGSFSISYSIMGTVFEKLDPQEVSATFKQFEANREIISNRWQTEENFIYSNDIFYNPLDSTFLPNYAEGYGPYSQDVLIPAFIAAYTGKSANDVSLNAFSSVPKPNYRITYNGLSKLPGFKKLFSSFTVTSAYSSTLSLNSFTTDLDFDGNYYAYAHVVDTLTGNYVTLYEIPNIIINESLSPLIGFDVTWINGITSKFDFKKSRTLTMSFIDYQLTQIHSSEFTIGAGYKMSGFTFPFKIRGKRPNLENDLTFKFDFSFRDDITTNFRLDQDLNEPTGGLKSITLSPTIDYVVNDRFNVQLYFDRQKTVPKISTSYPITSTNAGIKVRFSLAE